MTVSNSGLVMAAEDGDNMEICGISNKKNKAFPILRIVGHKNSEITGPALTLLGLDYILVLKEARMVLQPLASLMK